MLSPRDDDDDDSHLCIKCNATIAGLDNYVKHRKERCGKKNENKPDLPVIDTLEQSYSLGADVFFQSLELQSSVKKNSLSRLTPPISLTKAIDRKNVQAVASTSRDLPRMSPLESNLRGEDWIGGHSLKIGSSEDNQTKLINAVASISGAVKKDLSTSSYSIGPYNDYKGDDDSEESEDSDDEDEEEVHATGGKWKPPPNYTGGKWRPASPDNEEWVVREDPEYAGGKWKPIMPDTTEHDEDYDAPPPGYTKGKWVPGAHEKTQIMQTTIQTKGSVQYWCGPCNRRLGSRAIYEKHLMSNLHMKKVLPEHELEFSGHLEPIVNVTVDKRTSRPSRFLDDSVYSQAQKKKRKITSKLNNKIIKKKRKRKPYFVHCSGCKSRVRLQLMGKHLISHYHFRKATATNSSAYKQLILDNINAIVRQSPFQCSPCKFYTNWQSCFIQHWYSDEHEQRVTSFDGRFWCSFCKFECDTSNEMLLHMSSSGHTEVVAVINRSMPIIIRKKSVIKCETCFEEFRYNMEVKSHCRKTGHKLSYTATDDYQGLHKCEHCKAKFKSSVTLAAHLKNKHKQKAFLCLVCSRTFNTAKEATQHRQTGEHRIRRKEILKAKGGHFDLSKKCPYCTEKVVLKNVMELKSHIRRVHPNIKSKCPICGMTFILPQEVSSHIRKNACEYKHAPLNASVLWNCSQCLFTTDSKAECFFHEVLHTTPIEFTNDKDKKKVEQKYICPICPKVFKKKSLRHHLRQHTFERPFVCSICGANFTRQSSLANHSKSVHSAKEAVDHLPVIVEKIEEPKAEEFRCLQCDKKFVSRSSLTRHAVDCGVAEERRCPHVDCAYVAATQWQLSRHRRVHGVRLKNHKCLFCAFKSDQASHLKRHMICHKGIKPYVCPHCPFTCASLENLRKHVIRSGRHRGLFLYKCCVCAYETNMAAELRNHLVSAHDQYDLKTAREVVRTHLMRTEYASKVQGLDKME